MLSEKCFKIFALIFTENTFLHPVPFDWNNSTKQFKKCSKESKIAFYVNLFCDFCWRFPTTILSIHMISKNSDDISKCIILTLYLFSAILMAGSLTVSSIFYGTDLMDFCNKYFQTEVYLKKILNPATKRKIDMLYLIILMGLATKWFVTLAMYPLLLRPNAFENFYLYLGGDGWLGWIFTALAQSLCVYNCWNVVLIFCFPAIAYAFTTTFWLDFLSEKVAQDEIQFPAAVHCYQNLVICNKLYRNSMSVIFFPVAKIVFNGLIIIALFSLIVFVHIIDPVSLFVLLCLGTVCVIILIIFIGLANSLRMKSEAFLKLLSLQASNKEEELVFKSLPLVQAYVDPFFAYKKGTLLTLFRYVIDGVITLVLDARAQS